MGNEPTTQIEEGRFGFGENWARYVELVDDERIAVAEQSLKDMLKGTSKNSPAIVRS